MEYQERVERAVVLFKEGYNCSQAVCAAFADIYGLTFEQALKVSASFGGGIGRMRMVCGAASGMFLLAGLECGSTDPKDNDAKGANYKVVQQLATEFAKRNGSLICGELLGLVKPGEGGAGALLNPIYRERMEEQKHRPNYRRALLNPNPEARTEEYYKKRPCAKMVEEGARIFAEYLQGKL